VSSYVLSAEAQQDLEEIAAFIALDSPEAARRVVTELLDAMQLLSEMPRIGVIRTSLAEADVRFWVIRSRIVVYRAETNPLEVLRVLSGYRDLVALLPWVVSEDIELYRARVAA